MSKIAYEYRLGSQTSYIYGTDSYDSTKLGLGPLIYQRTGSNDEDKFVGPSSIGLARPVETGGAIPAYHNAAVNWSSTIDWVFFADQAAAAATRRVQLYTYDRSTSLFTWKGFITCSFPFASTQGVYTVRGFQVDYEVYATGTASVSGTAVTGTTTTWSASRMCPGYRIGFGSADPTQITTWYEISAVGSDTGITLTSTGGTIGNGPYCIEALTVVQVCTNGTTATNSGVFLAKGLRFENFNGVGTAVAAAVSTDQVARTNYWIKDAGTVTNTACIGCDYVTTNWTTQHLYVLDTVANPVIFKYNLRAALTVASGADTTAFVLKSGAHGALTGTASQNNNFVLATAAHGSGSGALCGYFTTTTRVYRTADVTTITSSSTTWAGDNMLEVPPGSSTTFALTGSMNNICYSGIVDKFYISTGGRMYCTQYRSDGSQWDRIFLTDNKQTAQVSSSPDLTPFPSFSIGVFLIGKSRGLLYMAQTGLTAATNFVYAVPLAADWEYSSTTKNCMITPEIFTTNASSVVRAYVAEQQLLGGTTGKNLGMQTEPYRISYRTTGISDDSGSWTILPLSGNMSNVSPSSSVQFKVEFKVMGLSCIPARILAIGIIYEDLSTDSHYQPSVGNSSLASKQFAWRFSTAFGGAVPRLKIRLYDATNGSLLLTDDTTSAVGTWEKSTNGGSSWAAWTNADKGNEITYLRYTPASLGDNLRVRSLLTLY